MQTLANLALLAVILLSFFVLGTSRLKACIRAVSLQGAILSFLPPVFAGFSAHSLILAVGAFILKGGVMPWLLLRAIRQVRIKREVEPQVGYITSLLLGTVTTACAFIFGDHLPLLPEHRNSMLIPAALATLAAGFLVLITRNKAITQVLGYLMFENGIFIFGMLLAHAMPIMVEAGVLLDLLVAIFIMGIVMDHINREFSTINTEKLSLLKE